MDFYELFTGIGYRLFLVGPVVTLIAWLASTMSLENEAKFFLYLIPAGQGLSFVAGLAWMWASRSLVTMYHAIIFGASQLYMLMVYIAYLSEKRYAVSVGMPIMYVIIVVALFMAESRIFAGHLASKVLIAVGLAVYTGGYNLPFVAKTENLFLAGFGLLIIGYALIEIGYGIGRRMGKRSSSDDRVVLVPSYGTTVIR